MNDESCPRIPDAELHAFVDAQLDATRLPAVLAWLQRHPADAVKVAEWQAQRLQLRQLARALEPVLGNTPAALAEPVLRAAGQARRNASWRQAAAVLLLVTASVAGGRYWGQADTAPMLSATPSFVHEAVRAHAVFVPEKRHPVEVVAAEEAHLVQWLSRRLGAPLKVPSLAAQGYQLLGGRLLPAEGTPRAQFMYENAQGARLTLFVAVFAPGQAPGQAPAQTAFRTLREGAETSFYWVEDRFGYALSGSVSTDMAALAREVYAQLAR